MKLSEYKGRDTLDLWEKIFEPVIELASDAEIHKMFLGTTSPMKAISKALKDHKDALMQIMAVTEGKSVEEFEKTMNISTFPTKMLELFKQPEVIQLFTFQGQTGGAKSSVSASEKHN